MLNFICAKSTSTDGNVPYFILLTENATRYCNIDGTWNNFANYDACKHLEPPSSDPTLESFIELPIVIYFVGYTISLLSLFCAVTVLVYFK